MELDTLFQTLQTNVKKTLQQMPRQQDGTLLVSPREFGVILFSSTFQLAVALGVTREDLTTAFERCSNASLPPPPPRIIT